MSRAKMICVLLEYAIGYLVGINNSTPRGGFLRRCVVGGNFQLCDKRSCCWIQSIFDFELAQAEFFGFVYSVDDFWIVEISNEFLKEFVSKVFCFLSSFFQMFASFFQSFYVSSSVTGRSIGSLRCD